MKSYALAAVVGVAALVSPGCSRPNTATGQTAGGTATTPAEKRYPLHGVVVSVDTKRNILVVEHGPVEGYMPAMTMEFTVSAGDAAAAKPGEHIRAQLIPSAKSYPRLEEIWPDDKVEADTVAALANQLRQDTSSRGREAYREIGETIPDFALYDQDGRVVQSSRFRGKQIMLNFIYTRCPVANMCPASTLKMMRAQKLAAAAGVTNLELVSISLDPTYDTPGVLKEYAMARKIDTSNFSFLTGPEKAIRDLLTQFGVIAEFKGDILQHTLATLLIDENGKIVHREDGSAWEPEGFVAKMKKAPANP